MSAPVPSRRYCDVNCDTYCDTKNVLCRACAEPEECMPRDCADLRRNLVTTAEWTLSEIAAANEAGALRITESVTGSRREDLQGLMAAASFFARRLREAFCTASALESQGLPVSGCGYTGGPRNE